jgi:NAD dependent epimerase/dehydratase family enzyme
MNILVTGAAGLIGTALVSRLKASGHGVLPLRRTAAGTDPGPSWNPAGGQVHLDSAAPFDAVIHLAGENIAQRWTAGAKARIRASRVEATRLLCEVLARAPQPPRALVCASATGLYGTVATRSSMNAAIPAPAFSPSYVRRGRRRPRPAGTGVFASCICVWGSSWRARGARWPGCYPCSASDSADG